MNGLLVGLTVGLSVLFIGVMIFGIIYWRKYRKTSTNLKYTATNNKSMHTLDPYFDMYHDDDDYTQQLDFTTNNSTNTPGKVLDMWYISDDDYTQERGELGVDPDFVEHDYVPVGYPTGVDDYTHVNY